MTIKANTARARLNWSKQQTVDSDGWFNVYHDSRDGSVDYGSAVNANPIPAWPTIAGKNGFLLGGFLDGPFLEGNAGFGFLSGGFLEGAFLEGDAAQEVGPGFGFLSDQLLDGNYIFGLTAVDAAGNESSGTETPVTIAGTPRPASDVGASLAGDTLTITWTKSPDDV